MALLWAAPFTTRAQDIYVMNVGTETVGEYSLTTGSAIAGYTSPSGLTNTFGLAVSGNILYV